LFRNFVTLVLGSPEAATGVSVEGEVISVSSTGMSAEGFAGFSAGFPAGIKSAFALTGTPIFDILNVFLVVFTETVISILLSLILSAGSEANLNVKPLKSLLSIRFLAVRIR